MIFHSQRRNKATGIRPNSSCYDRPLAGPCSNTTCVTWHETINGFRYWMSSLPSLVGIFRKLRKDICSSHKRKVFVAVAELFGFSESCFTSVELFNFHVTCFCLNYLLICFFKSEMFLFYLLKLLFSMWLGNLQVWQNFKPLQLKSYYYHFDHFRS